jgi:hypothetical protein
MANTAVQRSTLDRVLRAIPIIGLLHRCLEEERVGDLALFVLNIVLAVALATMLGGWAAFITILTIAAVAILGALALVAGG